MAEKNSLRDKLATKLPAFRKFDSHKRFKDPVIVDEGDVDKWNVDNFIRKYGEPEYKKRISDERRSKVLVIAERDMSIRREFVNVILDNSTDVVLPDGKRVKLACARVEEVGDYLGVSELTFPKVKRRVLGWFNDALYDIPSRDIKYVKERGELCIIVDSLKEKSEKDKKAVVDKFIRHAEREVDTFYTHDSLITTMPTHEGLMPGDIYMERSKAKRMGLKFEEP